MDRTGDLEATVTYDTPSERGYDQVLNTEVILSDLDATRSRLSRSALLRAPLPIAFIIVIGVFGALRPTSFLTLQNLKAISVETAPLLIVALGVTTVMIMDDFDLSVGAMMGLSGGAAVALMSLHKVSWPVALVVTFAVAILGGSLNGLIVARFSLSSFIATLATGSLFTGVEYLFTSQNTLYAGIPAAYTYLGQGAPIGGVRLPVFLAVALTIMMTVLLSRTEMGRYMYATGGSRRAAFLSGVPVARLRFFGYVLAAILAAIGGTLITAQGGAYAPDSGTPYLLPAYAAVFLGTAAARDGRFTTWGTLIGALFAQTVTVGLSMLQFKTSVVDIAQGLILAMAILLAKMGGSGARRS